MVLHTRVGCTSFAVVAGCKPFFSMVIAVQLSKEPPYLQLCLHAVVEEPIAAGSFCSFHTLVVDNQISLVSKSCCYLRTD